MAENKKNLIAGPLIGRRAILKTGVKLTAVAAFWTTLGVTLISACDSGNGNGNGNGNGYGYGYGY